MKTMKITKTDKYLLIIDTKTLTEMPNNINVYSARYQEVIKFAETENSYMNECFEILAHLPLNNSPILEKIPLLPQEDDVDTEAEKEYPVGTTLVDYFPAQRNAYKKGYNKAKEKYKYTESDVIKAQIKAIERYLCWNEEMADDARNYIEKLKASLSEKTPTAFNKLINIPTINIELQKRQDVWIGEYIYE